MDLLQQQQQSLLLKTASRAAFIDELWQIKEAIPISAFLKDVKPSSHKKLLAGINKTHVQNVNKELGQFKPLISKPTASSINWGNV